MVADDVWARWGVNVGCVPVCGLHVDTGYCGAVSYARWCDSSMLLCDTYFSATYHTSQDYHTVYIPVSPQVQLQLYHPGMNGPSWMIKLSQTVPVRDAACSLVLSGISENDHMTPGQDYGAGPGRCTNIP